MPKEVKLSNRASGKGSRPEPQVAKRKGAEVALSNERDAAKARQQVRRPIQRLEEPRAEHRVALRVESQLADGRLVERSNATSTTKKAVAIMATNVRSAMRLAQLPRAQSVQGLATPAVVREARGEVRGVVKVRSLLSRWPRKIATYGKRAGASGVIHVASMTRTKGKQPHHAARRESLKGPTGPKDRKERSRKSIGPRRRSDERVFMHQRVPVACG